MQENRKKRFSAEIGRLRIKIKKNNASPGDYLTVMASSAAEIIQSEHAPKTKAR